MTEFCDAECGLTPVDQAQKRTLRAVLAINATMFALMIGGAAVAGSSSLFADSFDNLGDALTYGVSLIVVGKGVKAKARAAFFKGGLIAAAAVIVCGQIVYKIAFPSVPTFEIMSVLSLLALAANSVCLYLLTRHRYEDVNMSSVWECSRNDIAANIAVFAAAAGVWLTGSGWPDIVIAAALVIMLGRSAILVNNAALKSLRTAKP